MDKKEYGPKIRISDKTTKLVNKYNKSHHTNIPDPKYDPIVVNNIVTSEFDYIKDE